jgi:hypothetical protein
MYNVNMAKISEKTKPGWAIPTNIKEAFIEFCAHVGAIAQEDCAGALFLWQYMPPKIREWAKLHAKGSPVVDLDFWKGFGAGSETSIQALTESQKHKKTRKPSKVQ